VTALSPERLEVLVQEYLAEGWERVGEPSIAKSVISDEPRYYWQSMCREEPPTPGKPEKTPPAGAAMSGILPVNPGLVMA